MRARIVIVTAALWMVVLIAGCRGGSDTPAANDSVTIDSISPSVVSAGTGTTFTIAVSYSLQTKDSGIINYGFQAASSNFFTLEAEEKIVTKGSGTATFITSKALTENNVVHVLLSENPHPAASFSPVAATSQTITVN